MAAVVVSFPKGDYVNEDALDNVIRYIMRLRKPGLAGGYGIFPVSEEVVIEQFHKVKKAYGRTGGKQIIHIVFSVDKTLRFTPLHVKRLAEMIAEGFGRERQVVYAVHDDTGHLHIHMGINTVAYNGTYCAYFDIENVKAYAEQCADVIVNEVWFHKGH